MGCFYLKCKIIILRLPSVISKDFSKGLIFRVIRTLKKNKNLKIFNSQLPFNNIIFLESNYNQINISLVKHKTDKIFWRIKTR